MGLSVLSTHSAGRAAAVKAGRKPVHFSLDGCRPFCYFCRVYIQHRAKLTLSPDVGRGTGASYTPCLLAKPALRLRLSPRKHSLFSCRFKCPCPPRWQRHFHGNADRAYNTLHFATQSRVPKGALPPLDSPTTNGAMLPLPGRIAPFVVSSPFHGLRVVSCKLT